MRDITSLKHNRLEPFSASERRCAFTLIEVLSVMGIMMILAGLLLGVTRLVFRVSKEAKARSQLEKVCTALSEYMLVNGSYPGYTGLTTDVTFRDAVSSFLPQGLDADNLRDPWGTAYRYQRGSPQSFTLFSLGADTKSATAEDKADDIQSGR